MNSVQDDESEDEAEGGQSMKENLLHDRVQRAKVQLAAAAAGDGADAATGAAPAALPQVCIIEWRGRKRNNTLQSGTKNVEAMLF